MGSSPTIRHTVDTICGALVERGVDIAPSDLGWAIGTFVESVLTGPDMPDPVSVIMQRIADECNSVRDE